MTVLFGIHSAVNKLRWSVKDLIGASIGVDVWVRQ